MDDFRDDLRLALRLLWKDKTFATAVVVTLSLCIGVNVALYTVVHRVLLKPLLYPASDRIVYLYNAYPKSGVDYVPAARAVSAAVPDYFDRLRETSAFAEQGLYSLRNFSIDVDGRSERVLSMLVTPSFFRVLGVPPRLGRVFTDEEGETANDRRVVIGHGLWRTQFAADEGVIGRQMQIAGNPYLIVGVMPQDFEFAEPEVSLWLPASFTPAQKSDDARHSNGWGYIARLKGGVTLQQAQAQIDALNRANHTRFPQYADLHAGGFHTVVVMLHDELVRRVRPALGVLWGGTWCVLLIGFVNVANLATLRFRARLKEFATRIALGASRWRVVRYLTVDSLVITSLSAAIGLLIGQLALRLLEQMNPVMLPRSAEIHLDGQVVAYTVAIVAVMSIALAAMLAGTLTDSSVYEALREEGRSGTGGRSTRNVRRTLIVAEVAFAFVLLVVGGLLVASLREVLSLNPGFRSEGVITGGTLMPATRYPDPAVVQRRVDEAVARIRDLPHVVHAGATSWIPFGKLGSAQATIVPEAYTFDQGRVPLMANRVFVTGGYLDAIGAELKAGRLFDDGDAAGAQRVVILDDQLANRFWPGEAAVGKRIYRPASDSTGIDLKSEMVVVGVISRIKLTGLDEPVDGNGTYYLAYRQASPAQVFRVPFLAVKGDGDPLALVEPVRTALSGVDHALPLFDVSTLGERSERSLGSRRYVLWVALTLAVVGILLSSVGLYGVLAYGVEQRAREFGVRIALGGGRVALMRLVLKEGLVLTAGGVGLGIVGALVLGRGIESLLFGVESTDPRVFTLVTAVLTISAIAACAIPARRAMKTNPIVVLTS